MSQTDVSRLKIVVAQTPFIIPQLAKRIFKIGPVGADI